MHLFYQPDVTAGTATAYLPEEESRHCVKVLRLQAGEEIIVVDGKGGWYACEISRPDSRRCELWVRQSISDYCKRPYTIHIAIAPTKNADRMEWFVEKCVEIGVDEISFVITQHSERRFFKIDRLSKIAVGAMKQSLKAFLPVMHEVIHFPEFLERVNPAGQKLIAYVDEGITAGERKLLQEVAKPNGQYCVLIGPEGDFSTSEVSQAVRSGYRPVSLGESRLRTETAGIVACHLLHTIHAR